MAGVRTPEPPSKQVKAPESAAHYKASAMLPPPLMPSVLAAASRVRQLASCLHTPEVLDIEDWGRIFSSERAALRKYSTRPPSVALPSPGLESPLEVPTEQVPVAPMEQVEGEGDSEHKVTYQLLRERGGAPVLHVPPSTAVTAALGKIGTRIENAIADILAEVEAQMLLVFEQHDKRQHALEAEGQLLRKHRWEGDCDSRLPSPPPGGGGAWGLQTHASGISMHGEAAMVLHQTPQGALTPIGHGGLSPPRSKQGGPGAAQQLLPAHLHLSLATVRSSCSASRAYLYLYEDDGAGCLRSVAVSGDGADASDISLAAGGVAATVFQTGVALSLANTPGADPRHVLAVPIPGSADARSSPHRRGAAAPAQGVLAVHTKQRAGGGEEGFTVQDEAELAALARQIRALLRLYPPGAMFRRRFDVGGLRRLALPSTKVPPAALETTSFDPAAVDAARHGDQLVLRLRGTQTLVPAQADDVAAPPSVREAAATAGMSTTISQCSRLKETARYIANLEQMWRNCIDEKAGMQQQVMQWQVRAKEKDNELNSVHATLKEMSLVQQQLRADVQRLRKIVAGHERPAADHRRKSSVSRRQRDSIVFGSRQSTTHGSILADILPPLPPSGTPPGGGRSRPRGSFMPH
eukprot:Hpha_TRINITY_DN25991_c0_g1::TRINITY_DN25991_c0_g1_i1::g.185464::m.185464